MAFFKKRRYIIPILLVVLVFLYIFIYVLQTNIYGDGRIHTSIAREIVETGDIPQNVPYTATVVGSDNIEMMFMPYPLTSQLEMSFFYMLGGEEALKLFSPVFGAFSALFVFLLLRRINTGFAFIASFLIIILNARRFIMVPLMEQMLICGMVASVYIFYLLIKEQKTKYACLAGISLGLVIAIKAQGLIFFVVLLGLGLSFSIWQLYKHKRAALLKKIILVVLVAIIISGGALMEQLQRNGTLLEQNGKSVIPFLEVKYIIDPEAVQEIDNSLGYKVDYETLHQTLVIFSLQPIFYYQTWIEVQGGDNDTVRIWAFVLVILLISGIIFMFRRDKTLFLILLTLFVIEIFTTFVTDTHPYQYHPLGITCLGIFLLFGLVGVGNIIKKHILGKFTVSLLVLVLIIVSINSYTTYIHQPLWNHSGRLDDISVQAYENMGRYVEDNTEEEALFLTGGGSGTAFSYYSKRTTFWISLMGGINVPHILKTNNETQALYWLDQYDISYIFIDNRQISYGGVFDYIPPHGLLDYIDNSTHFEKLHSISHDGEEFLRLYRVNTNNEK